MDLPDIYRVFHPEAVQYTYFLADHGTFPKIDHILGYKASLNKYNKVGITPYTLSDHN
jgi:exonuclease III